MRCCLTLLIAVVLCCSLIGSVEASINYSVPGSTVSENFDTLPSTGSPTWSNNSTLPGWYSNDSPIIASTGTGTAGGLYSYGAAGSGERALGSLGSGTHNPVLYGVLFVNNTGVTLDNFSVGYVGEQWRIGGSSAVANTLAFSYQIGTSLTITGGTYTPVSALDFTGPTASGSAGPIDGNLSANQVAVSGSVNNITWKPGEQLFLRWTDVDNTSFDHGLAIDDFTFKADYTRTGVVPEPASMLVWGGIGLLGLGLAAYKKKIA